MLDDNLVQEGLPQRPLDSIKGPSQSDVVCGLAAPIPGYRLFAGTAQQHVPEQTRHAGGFAANCYPSTLASFHEQRSCSSRRDRWQF